MPFQRYAALPLLPHEKQLISILGITEDEYQDFRREVMWRSRERPASYAHVPEIYAGDPFTTSLLVSLVVGALTTAASYLLTPKPQAAQSSRVRNRQLDSLVGRDRYAPTYGFQSSQELSRYGESIPIVFTRQLFNPATKSYTGGVMISPKLVWSRMFSWGKYQTADLVFLVSQGRMPRGPYSTPAEIAEDRAGLYLGQSPLDALAEDSYRWFYYQGGEPNSNGIGYANDSRLIGSHNRYGTLGITIGASDNAFLAPTFAGGNSEAFSHSYSPGSQLRFGIYNAIPNGTPYRMNWEIIPRLDNFEDQAKREANARRLQVAGNFRMSGTGRNYPRFIGLLEYVDTSGNKDTTGSYTGDNGVAFTDVAIGAKLKLTYGWCGNRLDKSLRWDSDVYDPRRDGDQVRTTGIDNESIISELAGDLEQYDDLIQVGTEFVVGNCLFRVTDRYRIDKNNNKDEKTFYSKNKEATHEAWLECKEVFEASTGSIGLVRKGYVINDTPLPENNAGPRVDIGQAWYPLTQADIATFQNIRECDTTEIGIRSQVWLRFNGITNMISLPGPEQLKDFDKNDITVKAGTVQRYSTRTSFFSVYARPANASPTDKWVRLNQYPLAVRGTSPRDQYNFIRVGHPRGQYEFRIRPHNSGEIVQVIGRDKNCFLLSATEDFQRFDVNTPFTAQPFTLYARGAVEAIADHAVSPEMVNKETTVDGSNTDERYYSAELLKADVRDSNGNVRSATAREVSNGITKTINNDPDENASEDIYPNIPWRSQTPENGYYTFTTSEANLFPLGSTALPFPGALSLRMKLQSYKESPPFSNNREWFWRIVSITPIVNSESDAERLANNQTFQVAKVLIDGRQIIYTFRLTVSTRRLNPPVDAERIFEANTAISEVSHYGSLISRSCDTSSEHEIVYVNESISRPTIANYDGCAMAGLKIRSSVNLTQLEQLHLYQKNGIHVQRYIMTPPNTQIDLGVGPSNLFTDLIRYLLTNQQAGLGAIFSSDLLNEVELRRTAMYLDANGLYYDDVITEPSNIRDFVASIAPSLLCNMVMRNGQFSIEPALPYNSNGKILDGSNLATVPIKAIFTEGNILEDTFELRYLNAEDRKPMKVALRYRSEHPNRFPEERTVVVSYDDSADWNNAPLEDFNFTHITSYDHAVLIAKYFLSVRRRIRHTISFKTTPYGISLAPGDYIRVITESNIYDPLMNNGYIMDDGANGTIVSVEPIADGTYDIFLWERRTSQVVETSMVVQSGRAFNKSNAIFALRNTVSNNLCYVVESLQLDEDGLVQIVASQFPVDDDGKSLIAKEITESNTAFHGFKVEPSA